MNDQSLDHQLSGVLGDVADMLIDHEQWHHQQGWDNTPPTLYGICRSPAGQYDAVAARLGVLGGRPADELAALAHAVEDPQGAGLLARGYPYPPVAHMVIAEGWGRGRWTGTEAPEDDDGREFADIPDSVELRFGIAVVGTRCILLERTRGEQPRLAIDEGPLEAQGDLVDALKRVHVAMLHAQDRV